MTFKSCYTISKSSWNQPLTAKKWSHIRNQSWRLPININKQQKRALWKFQNAIFEKNIKMYHDKTKGQLISKCSFGIFKSPKKGTKKIDFTTMVPQVKLFSFFFWENWRHQKDILKLTDLYRMPRTLCLKWLKTKWDTILNIYKKNCLLSWCTRDKT